MHLHGASCPWHRSLPLHSNEGIPYPVRREVGELASMLGAHIAPLAQEAVNLVSAAYLARTLSSSSSCSLSNVCTADEECAACCSGSPLAAARAQSSSRPSQASDLTSECAVGTVTFACRHNAQALVLMGHTYAL